MWMGLLLIRLRCLCLVRMDLAKLAPFILFVYFECFFILIFPALSQFYESFLESSVMKSTVINTSKEMKINTNKYFPPPDDFANFMHNLRVLDYLRSYASSFNFSKFLRLNHTVSNVSFSVVEEIIIFMYTKCMFAPIK